METLNMRHRISSSGRADDRLKCDLYHRDFPPSCVFLSQPGFYTCKFEVSNIFTLAWKMMMIMMIVNMVMIMRIIMVMIIDTVPNRQVLRI